MDDQATIVDPVRLAELLLKKGVIAQNEYDALVRDSTPQDGEGGAV
jgi:hypothetical protein